VNPFVLRARRIRSTLYELKSYFDFDRRGNDVVRRTNFTDCPNPVLLIYGLLSTRRSFEVIERRLRRDGYCVFSINLGGAFDVFNTRSIDQSAIKVRDKIEKLYNRYRLGPLTIIGHSKGGLIGRYYVKRLGGDRRVRTLITLGTPHNGTPVAYFGAATIGMLAPSLWQMTPMSAFIRRLKEGPFPSNVRMVSVYSKDDRFSVFPCALLETEGAPNLANIEVPGLGHRDFLVKKRVYDVIAEQLRLAREAAEIEEPEAPGEEAVLTTVH
jgi:triacylglycerol lipase